MIALAADNDGVGHGRRPRTAAPVAKTPRPGSCSETILVLPVHYCDKALADIVEIDERDALHQKSIR